VSSDAKTFVWCTYRTWSFRILEGLLDLPGWRAGLIVTTPDCRHDFSLCERHGIPILRDDPRATLKDGGEANRRIRALGPATIFHYGWSWLVPDELLALCPNVTLHPGKLPKDRGGSPLQNQIRNGETWSYANVMEMASGLDEGPVYLRRRFSLEGDIEDVWARMTAVGCAVTREYLRRLAAGPFAPTPQADETPTLYKRVKPADAELVPARQTARQMYDVIRAHAETDPNTYVVPAFFLVNGLRLVATQARLEAPTTGPTTVLGAAGVALDLHELCAQATNGEANLALADASGRLVYLTRCSVRSTG
jgi:methionyl-tRNA formyltransferase